MATTAKGKPVGTAYAELDLDANKLERGLQRVHDSLVKGSIKTEDAFKQLGIKSDSVYEKMRQNATLAFEKINSSAKSSADDRLRAEKALTDKLQSLHDQQYGKQVSVLDQVKSSFMSVGGAIGIMSAAAVTYKAIDIGKELAASGLSAERLALSLKAATGSYQASIATMSFLRTESQRLGTDLFSSANAFVKLSASAKGTSLEGEKTREIFTALSSASAALKLTSEETTGAIYAISQMMAKGTVQSEELRGQLSERLPGAFNLAAKAMGVTTQELGKMLEKGEVVSSEFLPRFARVLTQEYGAAATDAADSTQAAVNRMNNSWEEAKRTIGESLLPSIAKAAEKINSLIQSIAPDKLTDLEKIGVLTDKIANLQGRMSQPGMGWVLGDELKKAQEDLQKLQYASAGVTRETGSWARGVREMNAALNERFSKGDSWLSFAKGKEAADDRGAVAYIKTLQEETKKADKAAHNYFNTIFDMVEFSPFPDMVSDIKEHNRLLEAAAKTALDYRNRLNVLTMPAGYDSDSFIGMGEANKRAEKMLIDSSKKTMTEMEKMSERTAEAMEKNFSNFFFDTMTGKFKSLEDFATGTMQSIARMVSDYMGQIAREMIFGTKGGGEGLASSFGSAIGSWFNSDTSGGGAYVDMGPTPAGLMTSSMSTASSPTRGGSGSSPNMVFNVVNNAPNAQVSQPKVDFNLQGMVIDMVIDGVNRDVNGARSFFGGRQ